MTHRTRNKKQPHVMIMPLTASNISTSIQVIGELCGASNIYSIPQKKI
ncbi:MAG: hypothetical protein KBD24_01705 [Candidatus Pacebacteria bacterium]|nr:hypothetical protein [Candidatus Paceibacterota bacterium]